jgi:hypothetical protein
MLGSTYKIISKSLFNKLQPFLLSWIRPNQTNFFQGKFILDNVFLVFKAMEWATESDQNLVMLLLNFEKSYNRIN